MAISFSHTPAAVYASTARTLLYGPVPAGKTVIVFAGTLANNDVTNKQSHWVTLEVKDNANNYTALLTQLPLKFGSTSKVPKKVLLPGESIYVSSDANNAVQCSLELMIQE